MKKLPVAFALLFSALAITACTEVVTTVSVVTTQPSCSVVSSSVCSCEEVSSSSVSSIVEEVEQEYVERTSPAASIVALPAMETIYNLDLTTTTPVESFTGAWASSKITYTAPVTGILKIENNGFPTEVDNPKLIKQDVDGIHFDIPKVGAASNNGQIRLILGAANIPAVLGAEYSVYIEYKWDVARPLRVIYANQDTSKGWGDGLYAYKPIGNTTFEKVRLMPFYLPGVPGTATTITNTINFDMRVGFLDAGVQTMNTFVDQTLTIKSISIVKTGVLSINTKNSATQIKAFALGGENVTFDTTNFVNRVSMYIPHVDEDSQFPAIVYSGLQLIKGSEYKLAFTNSALRKRSVRVFIGHYGDEYPKLYPLKDAPDWGVLESFSTNLTSSFEFVWQGETVADAFLVFQYGDVGENDELTTVKVENVYLLEMKEPVVA